MKATGIVRRIDDLGRVVIPKEIRKTLKIREGMPMEIFTDSSGEVILKKYSPIGEMSQLANSYAQVLVSLTGYGVAVCDTEQVIAVAGGVKKEILNRPISEQVDELVSAKKSFMTDGENTVLAVQGYPAAAAAVFPIVSIGDSMGAIMLIKGEKSSPKLSLEARDSIKAASMFLSRQLEE